MIIISMKITEQITLIEGLGENSNCYLVEGKITILIDTGTENNYQRIVPHIKKRLDLIINTHCHYDHIGSNNLLKENYSAKLAAHSLDAPSISSADPEYTCSSLFEKPLKEIIVDMILKDNDKIENTDLEIIHTPGHTEGSICLYDRKNKILFSGDTIFAGCGIGRTDLPGGSEKALLSSLSKISNLRIDILLPGHGEPLLENASRYIRAMKKELI